MAGNGRCVECQCELVVGNLGHWSPDYWCTPCDRVRVNRINARFKEMEKNGFIEPPTPGSEDTN